MALICTTNATIKSCDAGKVTSIMFLTGLKYFGAANEHIFKITPRSDYCVVDLSLDFLASSSLFSCSHSSTKSSFTYITSPEEGIANMSCFIITCCVVLCCCCVHVSLRLKKNIEHGGISKLRMRTHRRIGVLMFRVRMLGIEVRSVLC